MLIKMTIVNINESHEPTYIGMLVVVTDFSYYFYNNYVKIICILYVQ